MTTVSEHQYFLELSCTLAKQNVHNEGAPFGAVLVKDGEVLATGVNRVTADCDPTAHAVVNAIREACRMLKTLDLSECVLYTSCEPCPMCLSACYLSRIKHGYYDATREDAARIGFNDDSIYREIPLHPEIRSFPLERLQVEDPLSPFQAWTDFFKTELD